MKHNDRVTAAEVLVALRGRFPSPSEYAFLPQVRDATGYKGKRTADVIAMSLWPSRGLDIHGIEIKVSRSDWLREKKNPAKAEPIHRYCDRWWIAAGDDGIVNVDECELPPTWGLLVLRNGKMAVSRAAPKLDATPPNAEFLAAILRAASTVVVDREIVDAEVHKAVDKLHNEHLKQEERSRESRHWPDLKP